MIPGLSRFIGLSSLVVFSSLALQAQQITNTTPPDPILNKPYTFTFTAIGGGCSVAPTYSWSATGVPAGLTLDAVSGVLSGTPTVPGPTTLTVTVTVNGWPAVTEAGSPPAVR